MTWASRFRRVWDIFLVCLLSYVAITVPYRWGFNMHVTWDESPVYFLW